LSLKDRDSFHSVELVAKAHWELDGHAKELPPNERHRLPRWRIKLNGVFQISRSVELSTSYEEPGVSMAIMVCSLNLGENLGSTDVPQYFVSLFPFRSADFQPASRPNRELTIGKIKLLKP
jgi:hypothetical protein